MSLCYVSYFKEFVGKNLTTLSIRSEKLPTILKSAIFQT